MTFSLLNILEDGEQKELGSLDEDVVYIGREPPRGGIVVDSRAVSREHGVFLRISGQWYYKDLGSSNGSWLNGAHVSAGIPYLLRPRDILQLSDAIIQFVGKYNSEDEVPSVVIFSRGDFVKEVQVPEVGKVVSIGGANSDLKLDIDLEELPQLVVEKRSNFLCAYPIATGNNVLLNGQPLSVLAQLKDRDMLTVVPYTLVINVVKAELLDTIGSRNLMKSGELKETFAGWEEDIKPIAASIFGQQRASKDSMSGHSESDDEIVSDMRPGSRFGAGARQTADIASVLEEKVVFVIGFILLLVILSLAVWWLIS